MREELLAYLWKTQKFRSSQLKTTSGDTLFVVKPGQENQYEGPDFFNAHIQLNNTLWVGNVELHIRSSDWFNHNHHLDNAYDNVVLHVVWQDDVPIADTSQQPMPTLCLAEYAPEDIIEKYTKWNSQSSKWTLCEDELHRLPEFDRKQFWERLYVERLQEKTTLIQSWLALSKNNWEAVFLISLAKGFGLNYNGIAFSKMMLSIPWKVVLKSAENLENLEALFMGQVGLFELPIENNYFCKQAKIYTYLRNKHALSPISERVQFFRLRPSNFPTFRLAQLAWLLHKRPRLLSLVHKIKSIKDFDELFISKTSPFWEKHYHFRTPSNKRINRTSKSFNQLLLINTVFPFLFHYYSYKGDKRKDLVLDWMHQLPAEKNVYTSNFNNLGCPIDDALESQACLQLKHNYCDSRRCLQCSFGHTLLNL